VENIKYISTNLQGGSNVDCLHVYADILKEQLNKGVMRGKEKNIVKLHGFMEI